jgi:predicted dehydrogenase
LKGALIGAGFFAQFHADGWNRIAGVDLAAVADPAAGRRDEFARRWGIRSQFDSAAEMLERERPDFVDIATRPDSHLELTRLAARAGAHVLCQKPMAPSPEDCWEMVRACREAGVRLIIHENWRWQPWYREIHLLADAGHFGQIYHIGVHMRTGDGRGTQPYTVQPYFRDMPRLLIHESLVHFLDTFRYLAGEVESVYCTTRRLNPVIQGEDYALIYVRFHSGAHGVIDANRISGPMPPPVAFGDLRLEGERAWVRMNSAGDLWLAAFGQPEMPHSFDKPDAGYKGDSVRAFQAHALECLVSGKRAESEGEEYLKTVAAVEACYRSAASRREEEIA